MAATIGKTVRESTPHWPEAPVRPLGINKQGAPNILVILFDDVGFSDFGCYGSPIATPTIDAIAGRGLRYTGFHTTAMCSTTRAALLIDADGAGRRLRPVGRGLPHRLADCRRHAFPRCFASCLLPQPRNQLVRPHSSG